MRYQSSPVEYPCHLGPRGQGEGVCYLSPLGAEVWGPGQGSGVCLRELYSHSQGLRIQTGMRRGNRLSCKHFLLVEANLKSEVKGDAICRGQAGPQGR